VDLSAAASNAGLVKLMNEIKHPLAFCIDHGFFHAQMIGLSGSRVGFRNIQVGCHVRGCGRACEFIPGEYDTTTEKLNVLIDPSISPEALAALKDIIEKVLDGKLAPELAEAAVRKIAPKAVGLFKNWTRAEVIALAAPLLAAITAIVIAKTTPPATTIVNVQPVIEIVVERSRHGWLSSSSLSKTPLPRPKPKGR